MRAHDAALKRDARDTAATAAGQVDTPTAFVEFPCSSMQNQLWLQDRVSPGDTSLNVAVRWGLEGRLSVDVIQRGFEALIARHEVLRTVFVERNGAPVQRVLPTMPFRLSVVDLRGMPESTRHPEAARIGQGQARAAFDLAKGPLIRATLLLLGENASELLVTTHHIACDGWSNGILARDFGTLCEAFARHEPYELPELPLQYGDFAAWQLAWLASAGQQQESDYWAAQLAGLPYFEVPADRPRPPVQTTNGAMSSRLLPRSLTDALQALAQREGCTFFTMAASLVAALLSRWTGETEVVLGTQIANRDEVELENLVGCFINTLVLRSSLSDNPPFTALLAEMGLKIEGALEHRHLPIDRVVELLRPQRDPSRPHPLLSVNLIMHRAYIHRSSYNGFAITGLPSASPGAIYDLNFILVERASEGWRLSCEYNSDLFEPETVVRMLCCLQRLMEGVAGNPARRVSELPLLDAAERQLLLESLNNTEAPFPADATLPELLAAQVERHPEAPAAECGGLVLTYRQLDSKANRLAHVLRRHGIGRGDRVGIHLRPSLEALVTLLATLKAGATFVPLDPAYPAQRLAQIVEDSDPTAIVVDSATGVHSLPAEQRFFEHSALAGESENEPSTPLASGLLPTDLVYVIFTSGSTGRPKGVQIQHRALINFLWAFRDRPGLSSDDVLLSITTLSFDISVLEFFLPLLCGAKLVIAETQDTSDPALLLRLLHRHRPTVLQTTPARWNMLIEAGWEGAPRIKRMLIGGEALSRPLADALLSRGSELWNIYGPTETTVWSSALRVGQGTGAVPIGEPIANMQYHVLDQHMNLVPVGAPGELWIAGEGVSPGYIGRPELSAERFLPNPFTADRSKRIYRTGDLVRRRHDNTFEFRGRTDFQVKLRGFRVELGEVEEALLAQPEIAAAAAIARQDASGSEASLVAYITLSPEAWRETGDLVGVLRQRLAQRLPGYMVPTAIVTLDALPRTPNGKLDRRSLPAPASASSAVKTLAPELSLAEQRLAAIWQELLGTARIGPDANFFDLGGHSLLAARMLARAREVFGKTIPLAALFQQPTLRGIAAQLQQIEAVETWESIVPVQPKGSRQPIFALCNTGVFHHLAQHLGQDQPFIAVQALDPDAPPENHPSDLHDIAARYVKAIRETQPRGPYIILGLCSAGRLGYEVAQQLLAIGEAVPLLVVVDGWAPGYPNRISSVSRTEALRTRLAFRAVRFGGQIKRVLNGTQTVGGFLANRDFVRRIRLRLLRFLVAQEVIEALPPGARNNLFVHHLETAVRRYVPQPLDGDLLIFYGPEQPRGRFLDPSFGWRHLARKRLEVVAVPGDTTGRFHDHHQGLFLEPGAEVMAKHIAAALRRLEDPDRAG